MAFEPRRTTMPRKRHKPEEIVAKLRQVDVLVSQGQSVTEAVRSIGVTEVTYYRWRHTVTGTRSLSDGCLCSVPARRRLPMAEKDLKALFLHLLNDTYSAEKAILKALPEMAQAAQSEELRGAFAVHLKETEEQVKRLERVFKLAGEQAEGVECKAIQAIIEEGQEIRKEFEGGEALDAGLIAAAQAVEHYEITRYGTLLAWANQLGLSDAEELLKETLVEEENTDAVLSELAEEAINPAAAA